MGQLPPRCTRPRRPSCCLPDGERHIAFARNLLRRKARGFFVGTERYEKGSEHGRGREGKWSRRGAGSPDPALRPVTHAVRQVPLPRAARPARPHVARPPVHPRPALGQRRPARRQPGAHRPHGPGAQAGAVPDADRRRLQGDRGRVPLRVADGLRLPAAHHRRRARPGRRRDPGAGAVPPGADRADVRVAGRRVPGRRALLQLRVRAAAPRRLRPGQGRHRRHRGEGRRALQEVRGPSLRDRHPLRVLARELHGDRAGLRASRSARR